MERVCVQVGGLGWRVRVSVCPFSYLSNGWMDFDNFFLFESSQKIKGTCHPPFFDCVTPCDGDASHVTKNGVF